MKNTREIDVLIVGGGPAGLSAALSLGRLGRSALICDDGRPRNAPAQHMNNFPSHDGMPPAEWRSAARANLGKYPTIEFSNQSVSTIEKKEGRFEALDRKFRKVLLAYGIQDRLPEIPGFKEIWGKSLFHCPYCHGFEVRGEPTGLYGAGEFPKHLGPLLLGVSRDLILFTDGPSGFDDETTAQFARNGVRIHEEKIERLDIDDTRLRSIVFKDGGSVERKYLFQIPIFPLQTKSNLGSELGCEKTEFGTYKVEEGGRTTVPGVFAAGDLIDPRKQSVILSCASGSFAGATIVHDLQSEDFHAAR